MSPLAGMPRGVLFALMACVLAVHLWLLGRAWTAMRVRAPATVPTFTTRRIESPVTVTPVAPPAPANAVAPSLQSAIGPPPRRRRALAGLQLAQTRAAAAAPDDTARGGPVAIEPADNPLTRFSVPEPTALHYDVTAQVRGRQLQGTSDLNWQHDGRRYETVWELAVPTLPPRRQHSAGELAGTGLAPQRYAEKSRGEQATHFERAEQRLVFSNNRPAAPLAPGAQDRLSVLLQLSATLAGEPQRYPPGTMIALQTATTREAATWQFTVEGEEAVQLPAGLVPTVKLVRPPRGEYDARMEVWLAPGAAYVPVRLRLTQPNGDWIDHQWSTTDRR